MHKLALSMMQSNTGVAVWDVLLERARQTAIWGDQTYPNFHKQSSYEIKDENFYKEILEIRRKFHELSWGDILLEEVSEVFSSGDASSLREELVQVAAVCLSWIEDLDKQSKNKK